MSAEPEDPYAVYDTDKDGKISDRDIETSERLQRLEIEELKSEYETIKIYGETKKTLCSIIGSAKKKLLHELQPR